MDPDLGLNKVGFSHNIWAELGSDSAVDKFFRILIFSRKNVAEQGF